MKNLEDYLETHYDIVEFISDRLNYSTCNNAEKETVFKRHEEQGSGGMYALAKEWTDEFTEKYKDVIWGEDLEYYETIEEFCQNKNKE